MRRIGFSVAVCLMAVSLAYANGPTGRMDAGTIGADSTVLPETNTRDGDGSGLGISEPLPSDLDAAAPNDVDQRNMGETGASGAVGTATGTTDSTGKAYKAKTKKGMKATTSTHTRTETHSR